MFQLFLSVALICRFFAPKTCSNLHAGRCRCTPNGPVGVRALKMVEEQRWKVALKRTFEETFEEIFKGLSKISFSCLTLSILDPLERMNHIGSMGLEYLPKWLIFIVSVDKHTIHGSYGNVWLRSKPAPVTLTNESVWVRIPDPKNIIILVVKSQHPGWRLDSTYDLGCEKKTSQDASCTITTRMTFMAFYIDAGKLIWNQIKPKKRRFGSDDFPFQLGAF